MFAIHMGVPEIEKYWNDLQNKNRTFKANKDEIKLYKKLGKAFAHLSINPKYPGLNSHEIDILTKRYSQKVFESYVENKTPSAMRIFWTYGPKKNDITIVGIEPHPNDKTDGYKKIVLSDMKK